MSYKVLVINRVKFLVSSAKILHIFLLIGYDLIGGDNFMIYTYKELKMEYGRRNNIFREAYYNFFSLFEDLYNPEDIKFIYLKNLFNSKEVETFFFFENKVVKVTKSNLHYNFEEFIHGNIKKFLYASEGFEREVQLKLFFDDQTELLFDNYEDSNPDWYWEYGQEIKELFKLL